MPGHRSRPRTPASPRLVRSGAYSVCRGEGTEVGGDPLALSPRRIFVPPHSLAVEELWLKTRIGIGSVAG